MLAALVQVSPLPTDERKDCDDNLSSHTEDYNASQKLMESVVGDQEMLSDLSVNNGDDYDENENSIYQQPEFPLNNTRSFEDQILFQNDNSLSHQ